MSGTSTDGVDAVLATFGAGSPRVLGACSLPMPAALRQEFLALNRPGHDELARAALAANALADLYAEAVLSLLAAHGLRAGDVRAIGAHGQTVRHVPEQGYTWQLNAPARLAERSGIDVIADFRSRDVAAGGQGAPLTPIVHHALFAHGRPRAVLNLGGIANATLLSAGDGIQGFDTGPANVLLDLWVHARRGLDYDEDGRWAASGRCDEGLLARLVDGEPWFALPPPKSTGRDLFNAAWLQARLDSWPARARLSDEDIQATLLALTADTAARAMLAAEPAIEDVLVCGGGALNGALMDALRARLPCPVRPTSEHGVPVQQVEALAFAWLAHAWVSGVPAGLPEVTGAAGPRLLGCRYPA